MSQMSYILAAIDVKYIRPCIPDIKVEAYKL